MSPSVCLFIILYCISFLLCINMDDWFLMWLGLEINMISFIFLIYNREDMSNIESCFKYFFVQSVGSAFFIGFFYLNGSSFDFLSVLVLSYKMGGGPFFFWFPIVCEGISWYSCFMLMTFQKFIPLMLMMSMMSWVVWIIVFVSLIMGVLGSFNQVRMKILMAFSSIHQIGWMFMCMFMGKKIGMIYYFVYMLVLFIVIYKLKEYEVNNYLNIVNLKLKLWFLLLMMNMGGIPPFLGFFLKWLGIYNMLFFDLFMIVYMILLSVVMFYIYMRICYGILMMGNEKMNFINMEFEKFYENKFKFVLDFFMVFALSIGGLFMIVLL